MNLKWLRRGGFACVGIVLAGAICWSAVNFFIGPALNEKRAAEFEQELSAVDMPAGVELVEVHTFSGNTSGTGNHVEIWGGLLCRTEQDGASLRAEFPEMSCISLSEIRDSGYSPTGYELFSKIGELPDPEHYYMLEAYEDAVTQWDIRGH